MARGPSQPKRWAPNWWGSPYEHGFCYCYRCAEWGHHNPAVLALYERRTGILLPLSIKTNTTLVYCGLCGKRARIQPKRRSYYNRLIYLSPEDVMAWAREIARGGNPYDLRSPTFRTLPQT